MKSLTKTILVAVSGAMLLATTSCSTTWTNTGKGAAIGGGSGAAAGAGIGALIGKATGHGAGKGAGIGAAVGAAVGTGVGVLIGQKMDKQQKELEAQLAEQAKIEQTTDDNGLQAIKVTFDGGILFATGKSDLSSTAQADLTKFAVNLLNNPGTLVTIIGYTDNTGSYAVNEKLSNERALAVRSYLVKCGVPGDRLTAYGVPMADYVSTNDTAEGRAQNRRVEIYIYASQEMINQAQNGTLK